MAENIVKKQLLKKLANGAIRKTGGLDVREILHHVKIATFRGSDWPKGIKIPKGMESFQKEERTIEGETFIFLFPQMITLEAA